MAEKNGVRRSRKTERDEWLDQFERWDLEQKAIALEIAQWIFEKHSREMRAEARRLAKAPAGSGGAKPPAEAPDLPDEEMKSPEAMVEEIRLARETDAARVASPV